MKDTDQKIPLSSINFLKLNNSSSFSFDNLNRANSGIIEMKREVGHQKIGAETKQY